MRRVKYELELASQEANSPSLPPTEQNEEPPSYASFNKADLKAECVRRGLATSGTKTELRARLEE